MSVDGPGDEEQAGVLRSPPGQRGRHNEGTEQGTGRESGSAASPGHGESGGEGRRESSTPVPEPAPASQSPPGTSPPGADARGERPVSSRVDPSEGVDSVDDPDLDSSSAELLPVDEHEEDVLEGGTRVRRRGVYFLPNLITTGALLAGFFSIIAAAGGRFEEAAIAIFFAGFLDGIDGRIARIARVSSRFGAEYDSLADLVSCGVAPALLMYHWGLAELSTYGWTAAFVFVACTALRLARFNTIQVSSNDKWQHFSGLASPAAAWLITSFVWLNADLGNIGPQMGLVLPLLGLAFTVVAGLLMVSNFPYQSFKAMGFRGRVPFVMLLVVVLSLVVIAWDPPKMIFLLASLYALSGPMTGLFQRWSKRRAGRRQRDEGTAGEG